MFFFLESLKISFAWQLLLPASLEVPDFPKCYVEDGGYYHLGSPESPSADNFSQNVYGITEKPFTSK